MRCYIISTMNNIRLNYIPKNNSGLNTRYVGGASLRLSTGLRSDKLLASTAALSTANVRSGANIVLLLAMRSDYSRKGFPALWGVLPLWDKKNHIIVKFYVKIYIKFQPE